MTNPQQIRDLLRHWLAPFVADENERVEQAPDFEPTLLRAAPTEVVYNVHGGAVTRFVVVDTEGRKVFAKKRRGVSINAPMEACWLVGRIDNVSVYYDGDTILVTNADLLP